MGQGATSYRRRGEEEGDTLHDGLVKLRSLVGKRRELGISLGNATGLLGDWLTGVDLILVDWFTG